MSPGWFGLARTGMGRDIVFNTRRQPILRGGQPLTRQAGPAHSHRHDRSRGAVRHHGVLPRASSLRGCGLACPEDDRDGQTCCRACCPVSRMERFCHPASRTGKIYDLSRAAEAYRAALGDGANGRILLIPPHPEPPR